MDPKDEKKPDPTAAADELFDILDLEVGDDALAGMPQRTVPNEGEDRPPMAAHFGKLG